MRGNQKAHDEEIVLSLGSNLGRREEAILEAIRRLYNTDGISIETVSSLYETDPVGFDTDRLFINAVCIARSRMTPEEVLATCLSIEKALGRERSCSPSDRTIDIDIVAFGNRVIRKSDLIVPHPRVRERLFVLLPLSEVRPGFSMPPEGVSVEELLRCLGPQGSCVRISSRGEIG